MESLVWLDKLTPFDHASRIIVIAVSLIELLGKIFGFCFKPFGQFRRTIAVVFAAAGELAGQTQFDALARRVFCERIEEQCGRDIKAKTRIVIEGLDGP